MTTAHTPTPATTRTRLNPEERREQIIAAAAGVFLGRDPADVTFDDIATAAGVSRALVYNYFGEKSRLLADVYTAKLTELDDHIRAMVVDVRPTSERSRRAVECYFEIGERDPSVWFFMGVASTNRHPALQTARRERFARIAEPWGDNPAARLMVAGILGIVESSILHWLDNQEMERDEAVELIHRLCWSGLGSLTDLGVELPAGDG